MLRIVKPRELTFLLFILLFLLPHAQAGTWHDLRKSRAFQEPDRGAPQQQLPSVCYGDKQKYGVKGENGTATFIWTAYTFLSNGTRVDVAPSDITLLNPLGDSISINWKDKDNANVGGIYTIKVVQQTACGLSTPYKTDLVVNTSDMLARKEFVEFCENEPPYKIDFSKLATFQDATRLYIHPSTSPLSTPELTVADTVTQRVRYYLPDYSCAYAGVKAVLIPPPSFDLGPDIAIRDDDEHQIDVYDPSFAKYEWSTDNTAAAWWAYVTPNTSSITLHGYDGSQFIRLKVTSDKGCSSTDSIQVTALAETLLRIPAAFTPNGDGINDTWELGIDPTTRHPSTIPEVTEVRVYDRWGSLVWYKNDGYEPWNGVDMRGRVLPVDSYHYEIVYIEGKEQKLARGSVTIVR